MPQGNAITRPPGFWHATPPKFSASRVFVKTSFKLLAFGAVCLTWCHFRELARNYTYSDFVGRSLTYGKVSVLTHEPLSSKEIDRMRAAEVERKKARNLM